MVLQLDFSALAFRPKRIFIGFSGGLDSRVLLHQFFIAPEREQQQIELILLNVKHHTDPAEAELSAFAGEVAAEYQLKIEYLEVNCTQMSGESIEAFMRRERYALFDSMLCEQDVLVLGHHQDDQAETFLLNLLRGAGLKGLRAMPALKQQGKGYLWRPLLAYTREELRAYAEIHALKWCEDPSNQNLALDRVYLRQQVLPKLQARWPKAAELISRGAAHVRTSYRILEDYLGTALKPMLHQDKSLNLRLLKNYAANHALMLLKCYLDTFNYHLSQVQLQQIYQDFVLSAPEAMPLFHYRALELRRFKMQLYVMPILAELPMNYCEPWDGNKPLQVPTWPLPLSKSDLAQQGLKVETLDWRRVSVRLRQGGERCRPKARLHSQTLNRCLQEHQIPPWLRPRMPLIYEGDQLIMVVGAFVCV